MKKKESVNIRIYKETHKRLKVLAARNSVSLVEIIDRLSKGI